MADPREILDHPVISQRYFFPRRDAPPSPWTVEVPGATLVGHRGAPADGVGLLHFHGNGEVCGDWADGFAPALHAEGLDAWFAEYRGYGASSDVPKLGSMLDDALASCDATGRDPSELVVYGRSVGSIYALHVAANRPVKGLVIESGIADVHERLAMRMHPDELGATEAELRTALAASLDHEAKMRATTCPVLVLHAEADHLVPISHAERLATWAGERAELVRFDRGDHNSIHYFNGDAIVQRVADFAGG